MTRRSNWKFEKSLFKATRHERLQEFGGKCAYCYEPLTAKTVTADHYFPKSKGGRDDRSNIFPCCLACNRLKGSMSANVFKKRVKTATYVADGLDWTIARFRRNINKRLDRMEKRVMRACSVPTDDEYPEAV